MLEWLRKTFTYNVIYYFCGFEHRWSVTTKDETGIPTHRRGPSLIYKCEDVPMGGEFYSSGHSTGIDELKNNKMIQIGQSLYQVLEATYIGGYVIINPVVFKTRLHFGLNHPDVAELWGPATNFFKIVGSNVELKDEIWKKS